MGSDNVEQLDDFLAFFDIKNKTFLPFDAAGVQMELVRQVDQRFAVLLIHRRNLKVVRRSFRIVDRAPRQEGPPKISPLTTVFPG
ncbi:hypothetical protein D1872_251280 [compost metagenome]